MNILVLQETDWLTRGPHTQHHIFEKLSENPSILITVIDYDIDKLQNFGTSFVKKHVFQNIHRVSKNSNVQIIRTANLQITFLRRISSLITNFFEILRIIRKKKPDIIVSFSITNGFIGLFLSKIFRIPFLFFYIDILHEIVPIPYVRSLARIISRFTLNRSDKVLVHTKFQHRYLINEGISPRRIEISPDGISLENTIVDRNKYETLKSNYSIDDDDFIIFFMGYLYEFAGLKEIIDYYHHDVVARNLKLKFLILGNGGIYNYLQNYLQEIKADWVILAGKVPFNDITEYIELADLCLLSFKINDITKEIMPIKILEYMAMRKPVLSNSLPGVVLELKNKSDVIFAANLSDLIKKIGDLIDQKEKLKKIGNRGFEFVKENYSWPKIIKNFKKTLFNVVQFKRKYKKDTS
ncbi:MAG: glycosyltransferase [Candidatus Hodarchaeales archaeon]|jgi:glycosyltransferase involved in cell wall biosynthesis